MTDGQWYARDALTRWVGGDRGARNAQGCGGERDAQLYAGGERECAGVDRDRWRHEDKNARYWLLDAWWIWSSTHLTRDPCAPRDACVNPEPNPDLAPHPDACVNPDPDPDLAPHPDACVNPDHDPDLAHHPDACVNLDFNPASKWRLQLACLILILILIAIVCKPMKPALLPMNCIIIANEHDSLWPNLTGDR